MLRKLATIVMWWLAGTLGCGPVVSQPEAVSTREQEVPGRSPHGALRAALVCQRCHVPGARSALLATPRFDHDASVDAAMPLLGAHARLECAACHPGGRFKLSDPMPGRCEGCHEDPHRGHLFGGRSCANCHSAAESMFARVTRFEHGVRTRFELQSGHSTLPCGRCHEATLGTRPPPMACEACHAPDSPHGRRFAALGTPPRCGMCHSGRSRTEATPQAPRWKAEVFDHGAHTAFRLKGAHMKPCRACHRGQGGEEFERLSDGRACRACHVHRLAHADSEFPAGRYSNAECVECHR